MSKKKYIIYITALVFVLIVAVTSVTYSWFSAYISGEGKLISVVTGKLSINYEETSLINVKNAEPIYDSSRSTKAYKNEFNISYDTKSTLKSCYTVKLVVDNINEKFANSSFKYELYNNGLNASINGVRNFEGVKSGDEIILADDIKLIEKDFYELRIWLGYGDEDQSEMLKNNDEVVLSSHIVVVSKNGTCN